MTDPDNKKALLNKLTSTHEQANEASLRPIHLMLAGALGALVAAALSYFFISAPVPSEATPPASPKLDSPSQTNLIETPSNTTPNDETVRETVLNASGYVTARLVATVSAEVMGQITRVEVEEGMTVKQGQVLAQLDDELARVNLSLAEARVNAQQARLHSTESELREAQRVLKRVEALKQKDYSSVAQLTRAQANLEQFQSSLASLQADLEVARMEVNRQQAILADHTIRSPFDGVITAKNAQPGEIVAPAAAGGGFTRTGICTIVDMNSLEIEVDVNEAFIRKVFPEQEVSANLDAYPNWDIPAHVVAIIPTADRAKATVKVRIRIDVKDDRILPDMGVKVAFLADSQSQAQL